METGILEQYLETSRQRLDVMLQRAHVIPKPLGELWRQSDDFPTQQQELLIESLEELSIALEELQVASEEVRQLNEELLASRHEVEAERLRYKELFDFAPDGYLVTDSQGVIVEANLAAGAVLKVKSTRLAGKPLSVFVAESERPNFRNQLSLLQRGKSVKNWMVTIQPRNGEEFLAAFTVTPVKNAAGGVEGLRWRMLQLPLETSQVQEMKDVVEEPKATVEGLKEINQELGDGCETLPPEAIDRSREEKQQRRDRLFSLSFEKAGAGIALLDRSGCAIESNLALQRILGYNRQELRQISLMKLTHPSDRKIDRELFEQMILGKRDRYRVEKRCLTKSGEIKQISLTVFLVRDQNLAPLLTVAVVDEISESSTLNCNSPLWFEQRLNKFY